MRLGKVLLLSQCLRKRDQEDEELSFVQYIKCVPPSEKLDGSLRHVSMQWASAGSADKRHDIQEGEEGGDAGAAGEWYGAISFPSTVSKVHVARVNVAVHPFTRELS